MAFVALSMTAWANDYGAVERRAQRYYELAEWPNAAAMYDLMLMERPAVPSTYGRAIVSAAMRADTIDQMRLTAQAIDHAVPFDSLFSRVGREATALGNTALYQEYLLRTARHYPWMGRAIDRNLLALARQRHDTEAIILYSGRLLKGLPDDIALLTTHGDALMAVGDTDGAVTDYERILALDPMHSPTLLTLGLYYRACGDPLGRQYLQRAAAVAPSPYLDRLLSQPAPAAPTLPAPAAPEGL